MAFYRCGTSGGSDDGVTIVQQGNAGAIKIPSGKTKVSYTSIVPQTANTFSSSAQLRIYKNYLSIGGTQELLYYESITTSGKTVDFSAYSSATHVYFNIASGQYNFTINGIKFS